MKKIQTLIILILLFAIGYLLFLRNSPVKNVNDEKVGQSISEPKDPALPIGWSIYRNELLGYKLGKPDNITLDKEYNTAGNRLTIFKSDSINFEVRVIKSEGLLLENYHYLDFISSGTGTVNNERAAVFKAPKGYCDGPDCTRPFIAYSVKHGEDFYNLVFYGDTSLNTIELQILGSFTFTK